jgi:hypothetical protein
LLTYGVFSLAENRYRRLPGAGDASAATSC